MIPKKYHVHVGAPVNRSFHPAFEIDAHALLWASAKGLHFTPATATIGRKAYCNQPLRQEPIPDARKYPVLIERIGYWETVLEIDDPQVVLGAAVVSALNSFHDLLGDNPLATDPAKFVATITEAAREWAEECFNAASDH